MVLTLRGGLRGRCGFTLPLSVPRALQVAGDLVMANSKSNQPVGADEAFVQLLTAEQFRLLQYIAMLLGDPHVANNVLQETNLVLWRKAGEFEPGTSFSAWSRQVAYWQVQAHVRDKKRDRHVFSDELMGQLAARENPRPEDADTQVALRHCLGKVSKENVGILRQRYADGLSIAALAERVGKTQSAVKVQLMRLRRQLQKCIQNQIPSRAESVDLQ